MNEADSDKLNIEIQDTADIEKNNNSMGGINLFLPIGMLFQFFFTVFGGGMLIAGIVAICNISKSKSGIENLDKICILLIIIGAVMFLAGIIVSVFMLIIVKKKNLR